MAFMASLRPRSPFPAMTVVPCSDFQGELGQDDRRRTVRYPEVQERDVVDLEKIDKSPGVCTDHPRLRKLHNFPGEHSMIARPPSRRALQHLAIPPNSPTPIAKMSRCHQVVRPMARCLRQGTSAQQASPSISAAAARFFSNSTSRRDVEPTTSSSTAPAASAADAQAVQDLANAPPKAPNPMREQWMDPNTTTLVWAERKLLKQGTEPIGSRRRRAAVRQSPNIPFEQLPYHAFQEARKVLGGDRAQKLEAISETSEEIRKLEARPADVYRAGEHHKQKKLDSLRRHLEYLKIQADINDPAVRRKWEDGHGKLPHDGPTTRPPPPLLATDLLT